MPDDAELLRRYAREGSDEAFAQLVHRYVDVIHAAALRQTAGDEHLARDVTQMVFVDLACKAPSLIGHRVIIGWLHTATRFSASAAIRSERRRRQREHAAEVLAESPADPEREWAAVRPILDAALGSLPERDREAVLLRFLQGLSHGEVADRLSVSETAARSRVDRALDRLRNELRRRGITSSSAALASVLTHGASNAAPAGVAQGAVAAALAAANASNWLGAIAALFAGRLGLIGSTLTEIATMKTAAVLLAASLAANAAIVLRNQSTPAEAALVAPSIPNPTAVGASREAAEAPRPPIESIVAPEDPAARLRDPQFVATKMAREGYPDEVIYSTVRALIQSRDLAPDRRTRWQPTGVSNADTRELLRSRQLAQQREASELTGLVDLASRLKYGSLTWQQIASLREIESDYGTSGPRANAIHAVNGTAGGRAVMRSAFTSSQVREEMEAAIRSVLTEDEATDYFRASAVGTGGAAAAAGIAKMQKLLDGLAVEADTYTVLADIALAGQIRTPPSADVLTRSRNDSDLLQRYHRVLGDEKFLQAAGRFDRLGADLEAVLRLSPLPAAVRAELFFKARTAAVEAQFGPAPDRASNATTAYDILTRETNLSASQTAAFAETALGKLLRTTASTPSP